MIGREGRSALVASVSADSRRARPAMMFYELSLVVSLFFCLQAPARLAVACGCAIPHYVYEYTTGDWGAVQQQQHQ